MKRLAERLAPALGEMKEKERVVEIMEWLQMNWEIVIVVFFCLEKIVKLSPSDKDDILVDVVWQGLTKMLKKENSK